MRVCQFRHFGKFTSVRGGPAGPPSGKDYELYSTEAPLTVKPARTQRSRLRLLEIVALPLRNAASQNRIGANRQITGNCLWTDASAYGMSYPEDVAPVPEN